VNNWISISIWAVVIGGLFLFLWKRGQVRALSAYVQETREELKKCAWPTWLELRGSTILIIFTVALLGLFVVIVDAILFKTSFSPLLQAIGIVAAAVYVAVKSKRQ
jgi:preprotein translocase subunit SecE